MVLPEPEGPNKATSSPLATVRLTFRKAAKSPKVLLMLRTSILMRLFSRIPTRRGPACRATCHSTTDFTTSVTRARRANSEATAKEAAKSCLESVSTYSGMVSVRPPTWPETTDTAPNSPIARGVAEDDAVEQAPLDVGQRDAQEDLPTAGPQRAGRLFLLRALGLHQRNQLAGEEGKGDEKRRQQDPRPGENHLDVVGPQPGAQVTGRPQQDHEDQPGDDRRHGEGQIDQGDEQVLADEFELGDGPGRGHAEGHAQRHGHQRGEQRETDRARRVGLAEGRQVRPPTLLEGMREDRQQRQQQEQGDEAQGHGRQQPADPARLGDRRLRVRMHHGLQRQGNDFSHGDLS